MQELKNDQTWADCHDVGRGHTFRLSATQFVEGTPEDPRTFAYIPCDDCPQSRRVEVVR